MFVLHLQLFAQKTPAPDSDFRKYLKGADVGSRKLVISTNILDILSGYASLNARYFVRRRLILEGGVGYGVVRPLLEYRTAINHNPQSSHFIKPSLQPKNQFFGCIHYELSSLGAHTFFAVGLYTRYRSLAYSFKDLNINNAKLQLTQIGVSFASQIKVGRKFVIGWLAGMDNNKLLYINYPFDISPFSKEYVQQNKPEKRLGANWQLNFGYIL